MGKQGEHQGGFREAVDCARFLEGNGFPPRAGVDAQKYREWVRRYEGRRDGDIYLLISYADDENNQGAFQYHRIAVKPEQVDLAKLTISERGEILCCEILASLG